MINKQNLLFLSLFSLILVLGVYYITMPDQIFVTNNNVEKDKNTEVVVSVDENEYLTALEVELEDERQQLKVSLEETINSPDTTTEEKNNAYLKLKSLNELKGQEELLEKKIQTTFNLESFVKIEDKDISVIVIQKEHDIKLANEIMKCIQQEYKEKMTIAVKFEV